MASLHPSALKLKLVRRKYLDITVHNTNKREWTKERIKAKIIY